MEMNESIKRLIGKLLYLTLTRLILSFTANQLSQLLSKPKVQHHQVAMEVLAYIKTTPDRRLFYSSKSEL